MKQLTISLPKLTVTGVLIGLLILAQGWLALGSKAYTPKYIPAHTHAVDTILIQKSQQHDNILNAVYSVLNEVHPEVTAKYLRPTAPPADSTRKAATPPQQ